eukprot:scaffold6.g2709.t1
MAGEESGEHKGMETKREGGESSVISVKVKDQHGGEVVFKVKGHTKFEKILNAYCQKKAMEANQVRFVFDGTRVNPMSTPDDVGMDDGDTIDAFLEQVGGC